MASPVTSVGDRVRWFVAAILFVAGLASLFVSPLPVRLSAVYLLIGVVAGVLLQATIKTLHYVGAAVFMLGIGAASRDWPAGSIHLPVWQPGLVAASALVFAYFGFAILRHVGLIRGEPDKA